MCEELQEYVYFLLEYLRIAGQAIKGNIAFQIKQLWLEHMRLFYVTPQLTLTLLPISMSECLLSGCPDRSVLLMWL